MKSEPIIIQIVLSIQNGTAEVMEAKTITPQTAASSPPIQEELEECLKKSPRKGDQSGTNKLTEVQVREIKRLLRLGASQAALGKKFGVSAGAIYHISAGKRWGHVQ